MDIQINKELREKILKKMEYTRIPLYSTPYRSHGDKNGI